MAILDYYKKLSEKQRLRFRADVMNAIEISISAFYTKLNSDKWRKIESEKIQAIIKFGDYETEI